MVQRHSPPCPAQNFVVPGWLGPAAALSALAEGLELAREMRDPNAVARFLEGAAPIFSSDRDAAHAAQLLGAAAALRAETGASRFPAEKADIDAAEARCRELLGPAAFEGAWQRGAALDADGAAGWAIEMWEQEIMA